MAGKSLGHPFLNFLVRSLGGKTVIAHFEIFLASLSISNSNLSNIV